MANRRLAMRQIKSILQLHWFQGLSKLLTLTLRSPPNALPEEEASDQLVDFVVIDVGMVARE